MTPFAISLMMATFLCSLVAGFLFAFAVVIMPGIRNLGDRQFLRAFQVMDRVIQNNQPMFILVWVGSVVALVVAIAVGMGQVGGADRVILVVATLTYVFGVQLPTVTINIPLNNEVQSLNVDALDDDMLRSARQAFEPRWNKWNVFRAIVASLASALLVFVLFRL